MNKADIETLFARLQAANPHPRSELHYRNAFELLVAVVLSAQATDVSVNKATQGLFAAAPTPQLMVALGEDGVAEKIRTIGLYRTKARNVVGLSRILVEQHGGHVPASREALEALPGVGRKTANVVLGSAYGVPGIVVDTHVQRLAGRLGLTAERDPVKIEFALQPLVPEAKWSRFSLWLIFHGRRVCVARRPRCSICPLSPHCPRLGVTSAQ